MILWKTQRNGDQKHLSLHTMENLDPDFIFDVSGFHH